MDPAVSWGFRSEPEAHADGRVVPAPRGRVLGGCASVNGMMYSRGCRADYDAWARAGIAGWGYDDVLPYFRRSESNWRGESRWHGGSGPLTVARHEPDDFLYPRLIETAGKLGCRHLDDFHGPDFEGFSAPDFNVHRGERASTAVRFLRPVMRRPNLEVITDALVHRLSFDGRRASGVDYEAGGQRRQAQAARAVVLSGRRLQQPAAADAVGYRPGRRAGASRHPRAAGSARRRPQPAGASVAGDDLRGQWPVHLRSRAAARPPGAGGAALAVVRQWSAGGPAGVRSGVRAHRCVDSPRPTCRCS